MVTFIFLFNFRPWRWAPGGRATSLGPGVYLAFDQAQVAYRFTSFRCNLRYSLLSFGGVFRAEPTRLRLPEWLLKKALSACLCRFDAGVSPGASPRRIPVPLVKQSKGFQTLEQIVSPALDPVWTGLLSKVTALRVVCFLSSHGTHFLFSRSRHWFPTGNIASEV